MFVMIYYVEIKPSDLILDLLGFTQINNHIFSHIQHVNSNMESLLDGAAWWLSKYKDGQSPGRACGSPKHALHCKILLQYVQ